MKVFWAIIAVLALSAGALWFLRAPKVESGPTLVYSVDTSSDPKQIEESAAAVRKAMESRGATEQDPPKAAPSANRNAPKAAAPVDTAPKPEPVKSDPPKTVPSPVVEAPKGATPVAADPKPSQGAKPAAPTDPYVDPVADEGDGVSDAVRAAASPNPAATAPAPATKPEVKPEVKGEAKPDAKTETKPNAAKVEAPAALQVKLEPQDDGSTLVDGKYVIKGAGTKEDPYRVTWEMLLSAEETYRPRLGKKVIPDRLKMLDGKWIRVSGYIAFPVMASSGDEMLMMLNQWDGCCIGVPPTPYDAIEVKLKAAAKGNDRLRTSGTLTGKFKVDPYLVKDWLISLYVMDDGDLSEAKGQATPGMHAK